MTGKEIFREWVHQKANDDQLFTMLTAIQGNDCPFICPLDSDKYATYEQCIISKDGKDGLLCAWYEMTERCDKNSCPMHYECRAFTRGKGDSLPCGVGNFLCDNLAERRKWFFTDHKEHDSKEQKE